MHECRGPNRSLSNLSLQAPGPGWLVAAQDTQYALRIQANTFTRFPLLGVGFWGTQRLCQDPAAALLQRPQAKAITYNGCCTSTHFVCRILWSQVVVLFTSACMPLALPLVHRHSIESYLGVSGFSMSLCMAELAINSL